MGSSYRQNTESIKLGSPFGSHFWVNFGDHLGVLFSACFERVSERLSGCLEGDIGAGRLQIWCHFASVWAAYGNTCEQVKIELSPRRELHFRGQGHAKKRS